MSLGKKAEKLKKIIAGMEAKDSAPEELLVALVELLGELAQSVGYIEETVDELADEVADIADLLFDEDFLDEDEDEDDEDDGDEDELLYEITCGKCGEKLYADEDEILGGGLACPGCGQSIIIEVIEGGCHDEGCSCCGHSHDEDDEDEDGEDEGE